MNCEEFVKLLGFYVDGQLPRQYQEEFELHLKVCNLCLVEFNKLKRYKQKIVEIPPSYPVPEKVKQAIVGAISALRVDDTVESPVTVKKRETKESKSQTEQKKRNKPAAAKAKPKVNKNFIWYFFIVIGIILLGFLMVIRLLNR